ncbi:MAG: SAM-dependent methyltransferase [Desulfosudis oleivorans]|nr:SAM-dependent methyltransferase [Desulfosudis oleivorans]
MVPERELRRHLVEQGQVEAVIGLPAGAFAPYTSVKRQFAALMASKAAPAARMSDASALFESRSGRKAPGDSSRSRRTAGSRASPP